MELQADDIEDFLEGAFSAGFSVGYVCRPRGTDGSRSLRCEANIASRKRMRNEQQQQGAESKH
jgi:hypothetical protein